MNSLDQSIGCCVQSLIRDVKSNRSDAAAQEGKANKRKSVNEKTEGTRRDKEGRRERIDFFFKKLRPATLQATKISSSSSSSSSRPGNLTGNLVSREPQLHGQAYTGKKKKKKEAISQPL